MKRLGAGVLVLLLLMVGCSVKDTQVPTPDSLVPGYYTSGQAVSGGKKTDKLNLRSIQAAINAQETLLSLSFVSGSLTDGGEETPLNQTPQYTVEALKGPSRLRITLPTAYLDYAGNEPESAGMYTAMYMRPPIEEGGMTRLYFQFTGKIGFRVDEQKGVLLIHIEPENPDPDEQHFATMEYSDATHRLAYENAMDPVLCDDGENMIYLSAPFATIEEADTLAATLNDALEKEMLNQRATVATYTGNWAPTYQAGVSRDELRSLGALMSIDGKETLAKPWAVDARFLTWMPGYQAGLCARPVMRMEGQESVPLEQLWIYDTQGARTRFLPNEFAHIDRAEFSLDGRYLALVEKAESKRLLYLYDVQEGTLDFLSSEGMGDFTAGFDWSESGKLYALSGDETMQLLVFDPAMTNQDESRVSALEERYGGAGSVYCANGKVYFNGDVSGKILEIDQEGVERTEYADGDNFSISPNGLYMLVSYYETTGEMDSQTGVKLRNMQTNQETVLSTGMTYRGSSWSPDGNHLSFLVANDQGSVEEEEQVNDYPVRLYTCDSAIGEVTLQGMLASDSIYPGSTAKEIILLAYLTRKDGSLTPITYRLQLP